MGDDDAERVIVKTLEEQPPNATHWSTDSMAKAAGISQSVAPLSIDKSATSSAST